jgi:hypothetical protein
MLHVFINFFEINYTRTSFFWSVINIYMLSIFTIYFIISNLASSAYFQ